MDDSPWWDARVPYLLEDPTNRVPWRFAAPLDSLLFVRRRVDQWTARRLMQVAGQANAGRFHRFPSGWLTVAAVDAVPTQETRRGLLLFEVRTRLQIGPDLDVGRRVDFGSLPLGDRVF